MHVAQALLAITVILLASSAVLVDARKPQVSTEISINGQPWNYVAGPTKARALRATSVINTDDSALSTSEERSFFSDLFKKINVRWWLETGKSEKDVMKALKLDTLSGAALTSNYKYFQKFVTKAEFNRLNKWLTRDVSTFQAWKNLGLHKLDENQLVNAPGLATYKRYVKMYDDDVILQLGAYKVPSMTSVGSPAEMAVKTRLWAQSKRSVDYVKKVLSLEGLSDSAMKSHENYKYFKQFLDARKSVN